MKQLRDHVIARYGFDPDKLDGVVHSEVIDGMLVVDSREPDYDAYPNWVERDPPGKNKPGCYRHYFKPLDEEGAFTMERAATGGRSTRNGLTASVSQRAKVRDLDCLVCHQRPVDPAHLIPRSLGGCDHRECVIPLCRACHDAYDLGDLDISRFVWPAYDRECLHAITQHMGPFRFVKHVTGQRSADTDPARVA